LVLLNEQLCLNFKQSPASGACTPNYFDGLDPRRLVDRREKPQTRKTFEVAELHETHHEIMRRLLLGQKSSAIAEDLGVSRAMVSYVKNSRVVQERLNEMQGARDAETVDLAVEIRKQAPKALKLLNKIIEGEIDAPITTRAREANNWLDRAGFGAVKRVEGNFAHAHFTPEEIEDIKRRAIENGFARPSAATKHLIDVTPLEKQDSSDGVG
jgi:predicted transcriptional regulator